MALSQVTIYRAYTEYAPNLEVDSTENFVRHLRKGDIFFLNKMI